MRVLPHIPVQRGDFAGKTDLVIAGRYFETLAPENLRSIFPAIEQEYARTVAEALPIAGDTGLLSNQAELSRVLGVRGTYPEFC